MFKAVPHLGGAALGANHVFAAGLQQRSMATLKEIQMRLKSVQNIAKITKSMKMIAATKMTRAQRAMEVARQYSHSSNELFEQAHANTFKELSDAETLVLASSSDRGLCGGIHSSVSRGTKRYLAQHPSTGLVVLGDKVKTQLARDYKNSIRISFNQIGKNVPTFGEASAVVDTLHAEKLHFELLKLFYNQFVSAIAFQLDHKDIYSEAILKQVPDFAKFELEDDVLQNLCEFTLANALYGVMSEGHAAEQAAKRTAMENATKNAGEMIDKLTLTYNRTRQAAITNDLVDIITGASAL